MNLTEESINQIHVNMSYDSICTCEDKCKEDACIKFLLYKGAGILYCYRYDISPTTENIMSFYTEENHSIYNLLKQLDYEWSHTTVATLVHKDYVKFTSSDGNKHTHTKLLVAYQIEELLSILGYVGIGDGWFVMLVRRNNCGNNSL